MWLGLGAGWYAEEALGLGLPFPNRAERYVMLEETLRLARRMFAGDDRPFDGDHLHLTRPLNSPQPIRKGGPPILIGGDGKEKTLKLVAKYADACNVSGTYYASMQAIADTFAALRRHCHEVGRDYEEIERTVLDTFELRSPADFGTMVDRCREMAHLGVQTVIFNVPHAFDAETIHKVAVDVAPQVSVL
jgi:alkanesulfonate monooxygenase SsuD/methylene tetrahydromethanopterin reductase-like flavin-dependent oxidoreductase (luciferase family)